MKGHTTSASLFGQEMPEDPYLVYIQLRQGGVVTWNAELEAWVVTGHAEVLAGLKDKRFSTARMLEKSRQRYSDPAYAPCFDTFANNLLWNDEPHHRRLRHPVDYAFQITEIAHYESLITAQVDGLIDAGLEQAAEGEAWDFVSGFAIPLPVQVLSRIVGVPEPTGTGSRPSAMITASWPSTMSPVSATNGCCAPAKASQPSRPTFAPRPSDSKPLTTRSSATWSRSRRTDTSAAVCTWHDWKRELPFSSC